MNRRLFLRSTAMLTGGLAMGPRFLLRPARASDGRVLVLVFMRGAVDGLNLIVPHAEGRYYSLRPTIAIPKPGAEGGAIDLDGSHGLHPSAAALQSLWSDGTLAIVHACGSPDPTRSHFSAMASMESGTPGSTSDGWINRYLQTAPDRSGTAFRGVFIGGALPHAMLGNSPALALSSLRSLQMGKGTRGELRFEAITKMYEDRGDTIGEAGGEAVEAIEMAAKLNPDTYKPANGAVYPSSDFGQNLKQVAQMIKADVGVEVAETDVEGWDTHANEGASTGQLGRLVEDLSKSLQAFATDLRDELDRVVLVTMSEFGRTAAENGSAGTDHGHGTVWMALGGSVAGGKIYGQWPGLDAADLFEERDLAVKTDFRLVLSEVLDRHMGSASLAKIFPGYSYDSAKALGLIST